MKIQDYCDTVEGALHLKVPLQQFCRGFIVTDDSRINHQLDMLERAGQGHLPLTIRGEKGSGKDRIADHAHRISNRSKAPLIKTNCSYLTEEQMYIELFGTAARPDLGLLHRAAGGSLYIENVDLMSVYMQSQLMNHILQHSSETGSVRYMICLQDQQDSSPILSETMSDYFSSMVFDIPPLRQRPQDILLLTFQQLHQVWNEYRLERTIGPAVMSAMLNYHWPSNVRQLTHTIERMAFMSDDTLMDSVHLLQRCLTPDQKLKTLAEEAPAPTESRSLKQMVQDYEIMIINQYIERHGSLRKAASVLKSSPATLSRKITEYNLQPQNPEKGGNL